MATTWVPTSAYTDQVDVTNASTLIYGNHSRHVGIFVKNISETTVFVGHNNPESTSTGIRLKEDEWIFFPSSKALYGITAAGTATVAIEVI